MGGVQGELGEELPRQKEQQVQKPRNKVRVPEFW